MKYVVLLSLLLTCAVRGSQLSASNSLELTSAIAQARPGDTIVMRDGVWQDADVLFSANGTATQPITLRAETLGRVHLTGLSRLRLAGNFLVVDGLVFTNGYRTSGEVISFTDAVPANNCRLINCSIVNYNPPDSASDTKYVGLYGLSNRVEYCYFRGKTNAGTTLVVWVSTVPNTPNYHVITRNYFGFRPALGVNGGETIRIGTSDVSMNSSRTTVEENYFEQCNGDAEFISNKSCENIFRHNTFVECEGSLCLRHGNGSVVEGNYFFGNRKSLTGGVRIIGDDHRVYNNYFVDLLGTSSRAPLAIMQGLVDSPLNGYFQVHRATVAFNTFVNCTNTLIVGLSGTLTGSTNTTSLPPVDCVIANNIVSQPAGKIIDQRITPVNLTWQGNIFYGATLGISTNDGTSRVNPLLTLGGGGVWRPSTNSPALHSAQGSFDYVTQDFEGDARTGTKDLGCDQLSASAPAYAALTSSNVGPVFMRVNGTVLTWNSPSNIPYGTALSAAQLNASANAAGVFVYDPPLGAILNAGTGQALKVVFTPTDGTAFNTATQTVTINVTRAVPVITWANPATIGYGTPLGAAQLNASANASGDFVYTPSAGTLLDVSNGQVLSVSFYPAETNSYEPATRTVLIDVTKGTPQISWTNPLPIEQGTALSSAQLNATANVPGAFTYSPAAGATLEGGTRSLSAVFIADDSARYLAVTNSVTVEVTIGGKRVPHITWPTPERLLAGAPLGSKQLNATANVPGRFIYNPPTGTVLPEGNGQTLLTTFLPDDDATFTSVSKSVLIDVATLASNAIVRVAYIIPSNRAPQAHAVDTLRSTVLLYQNWLAVQMERNGFGSKTLTFETEADGITPVVNTLQVAETDSFLRGDAYGARVLDAARRAGLPVGAPGQLWLIVPETHIEFPDGGISGSFQLAKHLPMPSTDSGWAMIGSDQLALLQSQYHTNALPYDGVVIPEIGSFPLVDEISFPWFEGVSLSAISSSALGNGLRNIAEALGLDPDFRNDENFSGNVMGFGFRGIRGVIYPKLYPYNFCALSYASALALDVNPFLNGGRLTSNPGSSGAPTVSFLTTGAQTPVRGLLEVRFVANSTRPLHAALLTWELDGQMRVAEEVALDSINTTHYSGSYWTAYFEAEVTNHYAITVWDVDGNSSRAEAFIRPAATFNRSPQPFITVRPLVAGIGQEIVMDASQTFDSEAGAEFLEIEWDIDGEPSQAAYGFDTEPSTSLVFTNRYFTLGTHVIRARMTDPAGAVAVSAPVAVNITVCPTTLSPLTRFHGFAGSTGVVEVTVGPKCRWNVVNTNTWIEIAGVEGIDSSDPSGTGFDFETPSDSLSASGPGTVTYKVLPNIDFAERQGYIFIGDEQFLVKQHGVECHISLSPGNRFHGFGTGANNFKVTAREGCIWEVVNTNSWIAITAVTSGRGDVRPGAGPTSSLLPLTWAVGSDTGVVSYAISENRVPAKRTGNIVIQIAGSGGANADFLAVFTVNQWGTNCDLVLSTTARTHAENAETGSVSITTASGCFWSVFSTNDWLTVFGSAVGTTTSNITYRVENNPTGVARSGNLNINGRLFTVSQSACSYVVSPLTRTLGYEAQSASVTVTAGAICPWWVENTNEWVTIEPGYGGFGTGVVVYSVTENPRGALRTATFNVAGKPVTITQGGKPCLFTITPEEMTFGELGGLGEISIAADNGCPWVVTNVPAWVTIISGGAGEAGGSVIYYVAPNVGDTRTATLVVGGEDFLITQASAVRAVTAPNFAVASGQTNCFTISMAPHGGENSLAFSLCFDTNLLKYRSAKLQTNTWPGATLGINASEATQGRVGFTISGAANSALTSAVPATLQVCLSAATITGRATTPLSFCDSPVARRLVDSLGRALPVGFAATSGGAGPTVDVIGACSLSESLDANFNWVLSGANVWRCQTNFTHDGIDAAESAPVSDGNDAYFETSLAGPGTLNFWWKVSSEPSSDRLRCYLDGNEQFRISGEVDWEFRSINLSAGNHTVRWRYSKNSSTAGGADRGWVDQIVYVPAPPAIPSQPQSRDVDEGASAQFTVTANGQGPLTYQWLFNGNAMADGPAIRGARTASLTLSNVTPAQLGLYSVIVGNIGGSIASAPAALNVTPAISLAEALDANLTWNTAGAAPWLGQIFLTHDGVDSARSGALVNSQSNYIETVVVGPGTMDFWWKISSETNNDRAIFTINGSEQARISGEVDWQERTFALGAGTQTLRWAYSKNSSTTAGQDRVWVDQFQFYPAPVQVTAQPLDQNVDPGATALFSVSANGAPPLAYQWFRNSAAEPIAGATSPVLAITNVTAAHSATYYVIVSNSAGAVTSSNVTLQVSQVVPLAEALDAPNLTWTTNGSGQTAATPWIGQTNINHDGDDAARSGRTGDSQTNSFETILTGPGVLSFWWKVSSETNDRLRLVINGVEQTSIGGEIDWNWKLISIPATNSAGNSSQVVQWRFTKNTSASGGQDRAWVDQITYVPSNTLTAPTFALQPISATQIAAPSSVTVAAIAIGTGPIGYQWLFGNTPGDLGPIPNATSTNLVLSNTTVAAAGYYALVASNIAGVATSAMARLTVITAPVITAQPANQDVISGGTANFYVTAVGTAPLGYQWFFRERATGGTGDIAANPPVPLSPGGAISGVTSTNLRLSPASAIHMGDYFVVISNVSGVVTSTPAALAISIPPLIVLQPTNKTAGAGQSVTFAAGASGSGPLAYQWRYNNVPLTEGGDITGTRTNILRINNLKLARAGNYSLLVSNTAGTATSSNATLTVIAPPTITLNPVSQVVPEGTNVTLTIQVSGTAPFTYRWRRDGTNIADTNAYSGGVRIGAAPQGATLTLSNVQPEQSGLYSVEVVNTGGPTYSAGALLAVVPIFSLGEAVNAPYLDWITSANASWSVQTNIAHDAEVAAQSGAATNSGTSWIETHLSGPGKLRFWWKVSSQTNADVLIFTINGTERARVSGVVDWQKLSFALPPGDLTLRWTYAKDALGGSGLDRGWLDEVDFVPDQAPAPPVIVRQPQSQNVNPASTVTFSASALGTSPLNYQWRFEGQDLSDDLNTVGANTPTLRLFNVRANQSGLYDCIVRNDYGLDISTQVFLSVFTTVSLPVALDTDRTNLLWFTGGYSPWIGQTVETKDQFDAAQSSPVAHGASNWVQTTLPFACAVTFWWKVSSETNRDYLAFLVNGVEKARVSGEVGWQQRSFPLETNGAVLRWQYLKNGTNSAGKDRAWLDRIEFVAISPVITNAAHNTNIVDQGTTIRMRVEASGTLPMLYQWRRNGTNISDDLRTIGATTSAKLILTNAQPYQNGFYTCEVANDSGLDISEQLYVKVNPSLPLAPALNTPTWTWETGGYSWWIGTTADSHDGNQSARPGYTDDGNTSWMRTTIEGPGTLQFWWASSTQPNADFLRFNVNGVLQSQISGSTSWQLKSVLLPPGMSICQWEYTKNALLTNGSDQVWVDEVSFIPSAPLFLTQPVSQMIDDGSSTLLAATVSAVSNTTYRWRINGTALTDGGVFNGTTSTVLRITGARLANSGAYSLLASNAGGVTISSNAQITVTPILPLDVAMDTTNIIWATGTPGWIGQTNINHDGVDAARCPPLGNNQAASMQGTVIGPGNITFWWRCSSEANDKLTLWLDNQLFGQLSGESGWQLFGLTGVPEGEHVVRWTYTKDASISAGQDRGWVDQFTFTPSIPRFTLQPQSQTVEQGTRVLFSAAVSGYPPYTYQWRVNGSPVVDGPGISGSKTPTLILSNAQPAQSGSYSLAVSNADSGAVSSDAILTVTPLLALSVALDTTNMTWTTNGTPPWVGQSMVSHDGVDAARSGAIGASGSNSMQASVVGPGTLSFWWKVSSETNNDRVTFFINNVERARLSGEVDWQFLSFSLTNGTQTVRWAYTKNGSTSSGADRAWVDQVLFGPLPPTIVSQPGAQNIDLGGTASFSVNVIGAPPLTYQWLLPDGRAAVNGNGISGATSSNLVITNVQFAHAGSYRAVITGAAGSITSAPAALAVFAPIPLAEALDNSALTWTTGSGTAAWGGHGLVTHDGVDAARSGAIKNSSVSSLQTTVVGVSTLSFWWKVSSEADNDYLRLLIDGTERMSISGEVDWRFVSVNLTAGTHTVEWRYTKDSSSSAGQDRGWVDEVRVGVLAPAITSQPASVRVDPGQPASLSVGVNGSTPLAYQWFFSTAPAGGSASAGLLSNRPVDLSLGLQPIAGASSPSISLGNVQAPQAGSYAVVVSNSAGSVTSLVAVLALWPSIAEAVDAPGLEFTVGGTSELWTGRGTEAWDGEDSAVSGASGDSTYTWIKTTLNGPGVLSFWWRTSSEQDHDWLRLMMDMTDQQRISGEIEWQFVTFNVPSGSHELQWRYSKNSSGAAGQDRAWVDQISFVTSGTSSSSPVTNVVAPVILLHPSSAVADEFESVKFNVAASGTAPLRYRWFLNGTNLVTDGAVVGGATTPELTLFSAARPQAGYYSVVVSNSAGSVTSVLARLTVNHILTLGEAMDAEWLPFVTSGDGIWEGHSVITHDGIDAARTSFIDDGQSSSMQTVLNGPGVLSFWWKVSSETNSDVLLFTVNDLPEAFVSGEVDWEQRFVALGAGAQSLKWTYIKNSLALAGDDRAWVDQMLFVPENSTTAAQLLARSAPVRSAITPRIVISDNSVRLIWNGVTSRSYRVEFKENLSDEWQTLDSEVLSTWRSVNGVLDSERYTATTEDALTARTRFYRVLEF